MLGSSNELIVYSVKLKLKFLNQEFYTIFLIADWFSSTERFRKTRSQHLPGYNLFVWGFSSHSRIVHSYGKNHHYRWRAANFDRCSALMAIEQYGFFSVPHVLWHGSSVYYGHLRGPVTLTPITKRLAVDQSLPVLRLCLSRLGFKHPTFRLLCERSNQLRKRRGFQFKNCIECKNIVT